MKTERAEARHTASISGRLLMSDGKTPHVACSIQAVRMFSAEDLTNPSASALTDEQGEYRLEGLVPGRYRLRCYILQGYRFPTEDRVYELKAGQHLQGIERHLPPFKKGHWRYYTYLDGLVNDNISGICQDSEGMLWFAAAPGGLCYFDGEQFTSFRTEDGLPHDWVTSVCCTEEGEVYAGTARGLVCYRDGRFVQNGLPEDAIAALCPAPDGTLWIGTYMGIAFFDGKHFFRKDGSIFPKRMACPGVQYRRSIKIRTRSSGWGPLAVWCGMIL